MSLLEKLQSQWGGTAATVATFATDPEDVAIKANASVANVARVASAPLESATICDLLPQLIKAGMQACDYWQDNQDARDQMLDDLKSTSPDQRQDLLDHLEATYVDSSPSAAEQSINNLRLEHFWGRKEAKELAQRLQRRDRDKDDRRMCVECAHFTANTFCRNHKVAEVPPMVGSDFSVMLQRCRGFALPPEFRWNK